MYSGSLASTRRIRPMWVKIAFSSFASFGVLFILMGALVMFVTIRHNTAEYHEVLSRLVNDLESEYHRCQGEASAMKGFLVEDALSLGRENLFLLVSTPDGEIKTAESINNRVIEGMLGNAGSESTTYRMTISDGVGGTDYELAVRVRKATLYDGCKLSVGYNVTKDERHIVQLGTILGSSLVFLWVVCAGLGTFLARRFTAPLRKIAAAAGDIAAGDYSARVAITSEGAEIQDLENAFNRMADENEKTMRELRTLTDDIAHDLRTPLTRLRGAAELALMGGELKQPLAEDVSVETAAMLEIINTMLEISQTENRISRTPKTDVELVSYVKEVLDLYSVLAEESQIEVTVKLPEAPVYFRAHKGKLQQVLANLLDNAFKFTPRGGKIEVTLTESPLSLSVANTGPGIAREDLPHIFKRFWRADESRSLPGNGLGLSLVQAIVSSYGGKITCKSDPGGWTVFTITN